MNFDPSLLLWSLIPSGIGFVLFVYGKKQERWAHLAAGIVLSVFPYFVESALQMMLGSALICAALWWAVRSGW